MKIKKVFDILLSFYKGKSWPRALETSIPSRKGFSLKPQATESEVKQSLQEDAGAILEPIPPDDDDDGMTTKRSRSESSSSSSSSSKKRAANLSDENDEGAAAAHDHESEVVSPPSRKKQRTK